VSFAPFAVPSSYSLAHLHTELLSGTNNHDISVFLDICFKRQTLSKSQLMKLWGYIAFYAEWLDIIC